MMRPFTFLAAVLCLLVASPAMAVDVERVLQEESDAPSTMADTTIPTVSPAPSSMDETAPPTAPSPTSDGGEMTPAPTAEPTSGSCKAASMMAGAATLFAVGAYL